MMTQELQDQYYVEKMERLIQGLLQTIEYLIQQQEPSTVEDGSDLSDKIVDECTRLHEEYQGNLEEELRVAKIPRPLIREILDPKNYDLKREDIQQKIDDELIDRCNSDIQKKFRPELRIQIEIALRLEDSARTMKTWRPPPDETTVLIALRHRIEKNLIEGRLINETWRRLMEFKRLRNEYILCEREISSYQKKLQSVQDKLEMMEKYQAQLWNKMYQVLNKDYEKMKLNLEDKRDHIWEHLEVSKKERLMMKDQVGEIAGEDRKLTSVIKTLNYLIDMEKQSLTQGKAKPTKAKGKQPQKQPPTSSSSS
jgi:hypothetical protein